MATSSTIMLTLSLLILAAATGCSGELDHPDSSLISAMQGVSQALECFSGTSQESLNLQKQNSEALNDLHSLQSLPDMIVQLKEEINQQNGNFVAMKKNFEALEKVVASVQEIQDLKQKLEAKQKKEEKLNDYVKELENQIQSKDAKVKQLTEDNAELEKKHAENNKQVEELNRRLLESQERVQQLETTVEQLKPTVETSTATARSREECAQPIQESIKTLVREFNRNKYWSRLVVGLRDVLDHSSEAYSQLQVMGTDTYSPMYRLGRDGHAQLVSLLLCAGLPVGTTDDDGDTLLHGAAFGGQLQIAKMLLDRGADVDAKGANGSAALQRAADGGHLEVVQLLVRAGASTTATNNSGDTALEQTSSEDVVQYLQQFPH